MTICVNSIAKMLRSPTLVIQSRSDEFVRVPISLTVNVTRAKIRVVVFEFVDDFFGLSSLITISIRFCILPDRIITGVGVPLSDGSNETLRTESNRWIDAKLSSRERIKASTRLHSALMFKYRIADRGDNAIAHLERVEKYLDRMFDILHDNFEILS